MLVKRAKALVSLRAACAVVFALLVLASSASAADPKCVKNSYCPEPLAFESARGVGLGTGVRASAVSTSALAYSPGALAVGNLYHIEGNIDYLGYADTVALGAGVVDSSTSKLGAGIGIRGFLSGDGGIDGLDGHLGLAFAISDAFALGLGARYLDVSTDVDIDDDGELDDVGVADGLTLDASLRVMPAEGLQIDFAALNFVNLEEAEVPLTLAGSLAFAVIDMLSIGADLLVDLSTYEDAAFIAGGGLEFLAASVVPLRIGYRADLARETHAITAGVGYTDQQVGFDIGLRQNVSGDTETRVMAAMRYYVH
jgi:hypothetical protein